MTTSITPQPPYREIIDPERGTRFVLAAPFFVKCSSSHRRSGGRYTLRTHRHEGRTWRNAIVLYQTSSSTSVPRLSPSTPTPSDADWDDSDSKWFLVQTPRITATESAEFSVGVFNPVKAVGGGTQHLGAGASGVGRQNPPATLVNDSGPTSGPQKITWEAGDNEHFFVLVQRTSGTSNVVSFDIVYSTTLSLLIARPAIDMSLTCQVETSGWGADDIALEIQPMVI